MAAAIAAKSMTIINSAQAERDSSLSDWLLGIDRHEDIGIMPELYIKIRLRKCAQPGKSCIEPGEEAQSLMAGVGAGRVKAGFMSAVPHATEEKWLSCPECEAPCRDRQLPERAALRCGRCGVWVKKASGVRSLQPAWALASAGILFVVLANVNPILTFDVAGNTQSNLIATGVWNLVGQGYWPVASLVFFAGIAGPALHLSSVWYVAAACSLNQKWPWLRGAVKLAEVLESWNLVPVYAVATVVAVVKLDMLGTVAWQQGALWVVALSICSLFTTQFFHRDLVEEKLEDLA